MIAQLKSGKAEGCTVHGVGQHGGVVFQIEVVIVNAMAGAFFMFSEVSQPVLKGVMSAGLPAKNRCIPEGMVASGQICRCKALLF